MVQANYVHGARIDELIARSDSSGTVYYHQDGLGSTAALTNGSGNLVERYTYDVYGQHSMFDGSGGSISVTAYGNRFLYTGREWLTSGSNKLEIYDYRNRAYSPGIGRFLQTDPILFKGGDFNIYRYVGNKVTKLTDPMGLQPENGPGSDSYCTDKCLLLCEGLSQGCFANCWATCKDDNPSPACIFTPPATPPIPSTNACKLIGEIISGIYQWLCSK